MRDFRRLDLNLLLVLDVLFTEGRVGTTASKLGVSQPTVSAALAKLRAFFGDELFVRSDGLMRPTPRAEFLQTPVRNLVAALENEILQAPTFEPQSSTRTFSIAMSDIGELVWLPTLIRCLAVEAPSVSLRSVSMKPEDLQSAMAIGQVDLALGYFPDFSGSAFFEQKLFDHPFVCMARTDHPRIDGPVSLEAFLSLDHAVVVQDGRSQEIFEDRMVELGLVRRVVLRSPHFMSVPILIANSDLITTVPRAVGRAYARVADIQLFSPPFDIPSIVLKQFWHRRVHADPAITWLRRRIATLFAGSDPSDNKDWPIFSRS